MPLFIGDFHRDTADFTAEMTGAYTLLCLSHWTKGPPPDDDETLARICKLSIDRFREIRHDLASLFEIKNGVWLHHHLQTEHSKWSQYRENKSRAARKAANKRWNNPDVEAKDPRRLPDDAY